MSEKKPNEGFIGGKEKRKKGSAQNPGFFGGKSKDFGASRNAMKHMRAKGHSKGR